MLEIINSQNTDKLGPSNKLFFGKKNNLLFNIFRKFKMFPQFPLKFMQIFTYNFFTISH